MYHVLEDCKCFLVGTMGLGKLKKLERLADYVLLVRTPGHVGLDEQLLDFLSEYMEVDETVHVLYIQKN